MLIFLPLQNSIKTMYELVRNQWHRYKREGSEEYAVVIFNQSTDIVAWRPSMR
jgi:hypothetical protein